MSTQLKGKGKGQIQNNNLEQKTYSTNNKTTIQLESGKTAITMQGGKLYPVMYKEILAGELIKEWNVDNITRIITPLVPTLDRVYITLKAFFVPHSRVWKSAEKMIAGKGEFGSVSGNTMPMFTFPIANTEHVYYKDTLVARYGLPNFAGDTRINVLPIRGYRAIMNDFIINKEYEAKYVEWNEDVVTSTEQGSLIAFSSSSGAWNASPYIIEAAQTRKGYLTNIKKEIAIDDGEILDDYTDRKDHLDWARRFKDLKQRQENANKNDWDIIAEMGGVPSIKGDRVQFLGEIDYELNYQQITQSSPTVDNSSPLGTTGSFSYTRAAGELFGNFQFAQHGFVHILACLTIDKNDESATPKELLKEGVEEIYRPGLATKEVQLLRAAEISNTTGTSVKQTAAFQPAWAEYKRLPRFVTGEMRSKKLQTGAGTLGTPVSYAQWHNFTVDERNIITDEYFRPYVNTNLVLQRNNIIVEEVDGGLYNDLIINMSEHKVTSALPMEEYTIDSKEKAEEIV